MAREVIQGGVTEGLSGKDRLQILVNEMNLIQGRLDKYDDLIFRNRGWTITIIVALLGSALSFRKGQLKILAVFVLLISYFIEILWRWLYMHKYVVRYEFVRDSLHDNKPIDSFAVYDLTHQYGKSPKWFAKMKHCVFKLEPFVFYIGFALLSFFIGLLAK